jgi:hypothetical protein
MTTPKVIFFEKLTKIDKPSARLTTTKKTKINKIKNKREGIITDATEIKR